MRIASYQCSGYYCYIILTMTIISSIQLLLILAKRSHPPTMVYVLLKSLAPPMEHGPAAVYLRSLAAPGRPGKCKGLLPNSLKVDQSWASGSIELWTFSTSEAAAPHGNSVTTYSLAHKPTYNWGKPCKASEGDYKSGYRPNYPKNGLPMLLQSWTY